MKNIVESFKELRWYENIMFAAMVIIGAYYMIVDTKHPQWYLIINYICSVCGVCCIFLAAHANFYNWLFAIVNTVLYCIILWYNRVYGTFALEAFYYMPTNIIGLIAWLRHLDNDGSSHCKARRLTYKEIAYMLAFLGIGTLICHKILIRLGGATAWLDSMAVSIGIIATVYEIKRFGEQYILWIITDVVVVVQWIILADPIMITKKSIYLIMAVIGLIRWRKLSYERNEENI